MKSLVAGASFSFVSWSPVVVFSQICFGKARGQCLVALLDVQQNRLRFRKANLSEQHPRMLWLLGEGAGPGLACPPVGQSIPSLASLETSA